MMKQAIQIAQKILARMASQYEKAARSGQTQMADVLIAQMDGVKQVLEALEEYDANDR